jgi:CheY-like chemotaxis protein
LKRERARTGIRDAARESPTSSDGHSEPEMDGLTRQSSAREPKTAHIPMSAVNSSVTENRTSKKRLKPAAMASSNSRFESYHFGQLLDWIPERESRFHSMNTSPESAQPASDVSPEDDFSGGCILVVDDVPTNVRVLAGILKIAGYDTLTAASGPEALEVMASSTPDVVLLDVMMPGMDGFEVCRQIRSDPSKAFVPVVMVTALHETGDRIKALECGADDFLTKPVDDVEVLARVKSLVRVKRQRDALKQAYLDLQSLNHCATPRHDDGARPYAKHSSPHFGPVELLCKSGQFGHFGKPADMKLIGHEPDAVVID